MKFYIAGDGGMVGKALVRRFRNAAGVELILRSHQDLELTNQAAVQQFFERERPDVVIVAAAKVGGIHANSAFPAEFIYQNLAIAANAIHAAHKFGTRRLLYLGSSCIYPRNAPQPMPESCLLTSPLEPTNEAYAIAKIAGLKLCQHYRKQYQVLFHSVMPTNLYGPGDNYHLENAHVLPTLLRRFHEAAESKQTSISLWGSGTAFREFLHVDDLADACAHILDVPNPPDWVNVGTGADVSIQQLAEMIASVTGYSGQITWDTSKPDGPKRKLLDTSVLANLGWRARITLTEGLQRTYQAFLAEKAARALRIK